MKTTNESIPKNIDIEEAPDLQMAEWQSDWESHVGEVLAAIDRLAEHMWENGLRPASIHSDLVTLVLGLVDLASRDEWTNAFLDVEGVESAETMDARRSDLLSQYPEMPLSQVAQMLEACGFRNPAVSDDDRRMLVRSLRRMGTNQDWRAAIDHVRAPRQYPTRDRMPGQETLDSHTRPS